MSVGLRANQRYLSPLYVSWETSLRERERCRSQTDGCDNVTFVIGKAV